MLVAGGIASWRCYSEWRLGRIVLSTDGPPLSAQVLSVLDDSAVGEPFDVGTPTVVSLPEGEYRIRFQQTGFMSQSYRFGVARGETWMHSVSLGENRMLGREPIPFSFVTEAVVLSPGKADFVEWNGQSFIRREGSSGTPVWDTSRPAKQWEATRDPAAWMRRLSYFGDEKRPGRLIQPAADLNGDGTNDLVWALNGTPSLLALSGKDGSLLWTFSANPDGPGGPVPGEPALPRTGIRIPRLGGVVGEPAAADVDGDGTVDVIAVFASFDDPQAIAARRDDPTGTGATLVPTASTAGRRVVTAVSGRSGKWLWNHLLDRASRDRVHERLSDRGPAVLSNRGGLTVSVASGFQWVGLDATTGRPRAGPIDLGFEPIRPLQYADLDGDGTPEMLSLGPIPTQGEFLAAFSTTTGAKLWSKPVQSEYNFQFARVPAHWSEPVQGDTQPWLYGLTAPGVPAEWPVVADLDGDGRAEVVLGYCGPKWPFGDQGGVEMLDGTTGRTRWVRPLWASASVPTLLEHMISGSDIDGDGVNDLVAISRFEGRNSFVRHTVAGRKEPRQIHVDALSGKDGHMLWSWHKNMDEASAPLLWPPRFWGRGPDGRAFLAVPIGGNLRAATIQPTPRDHPDAPVVHLLSSSTGAEAHTVPGLSWPNVADLDGDGLDDLWGSVEGKLHAFRGEPPETWRALGGYVPAADLDGDGKDDVLSVESSRRRGDPYSKIESDFAVARSGPDGRLLWRTRVSPPPSDSSNLDKFKSIALAGQPDELFLSRYVVGTRGAAGRGPGRRWNARCRGHHDQLVIIEPPTQRNLRHSAGAASLWPDGEANLVSVWSHER